MILFFCVTALYPAVAFAQGPLEEQPNDTSLQSFNDESDSTTVDKDLLQINTVEISTTAAAQRSVLLLTIKEAELLFNKANKSFTTGNTENAQDLYDQSLCKLSQAGIDAALFNKLRDDFKSIFSKLGNSLSSNSSAAPAHKNNIPMDVDNELVKKYLKHYSEEGGPKRLIKAALERSGRYRPMIQKILKEYDLPQELIYLPVVESLYRVDDLSRAGALGLWQIMPQRARGLDLKLNYWVDERKDPEKSTRAAAQYFNELFLMLDDWHLVLAGYNRGEFGLVRDLKFSNATNICEMADRNAVPKETQLYVPQFIAVTMIGENPQKYGYDLVYDPPMEYDTVKISTVIDLKIVAQCAGTTVEKIRALNPAIIAWCTPHNCPDFELHIPSGTAASFTANIAQVKDLNPSPGFIKYKVRSNDWLEKIAQKFSTTVKAIKEDNARVRKQKYLRVGQVLIIRPGKKYKG
ncbi:MAG: transglycosylase SLT domain-containing protein [Endomicrobiales bacterium]